MVPPANIPNIDQTSIQIYPRCIQDITKIYKDLQDMQDEHKYQEAAGSAQAQGRARGISWIYLDIFVCLFVGTLLIYFW